MLSKIKKISIAFLFVSSIIFVLPVTVNKLSTYASVQAAKVKISTSSKVLYIGYGMKLNITGTNKSVKWSSEDKSIATVTKSGYVTAKSSGFVTIKAVVGKKTYKSKIEVRKKATLDLYTTRNMKFVGTTKKVKYSSSNTKVASIDKNGKVTAKKVGNATITAKVGDKKYKCNIIVAADGWYTDSEGYKYYYKDNEKLTGWNFVGKYKYFFRKQDGTLDENVADRLKGEQSYYIHVNRKKCKITIFAEDGENGYVIPVMAMTCSVGTSKNQTPTGTFNTMSKTRWGLLMGPSYGQYCTRIVGQILFHSVPGYKKSSYNISYRDYNKLGQPASHGCIRLCVKDAKWIYDNCDIETIVNIDDKSDGCKFDKPKTKKLKYYQNYDPTDPNIKKK